MNIEQTTMLLARIQVLDNRKVDQLTVEAWTPLMANLDYHDAVEAVNEHFRTSTGYLQPAHIINGVRKAQRARTTMSPEAPDSCPHGNHRWMPDGTCLHCTSRREVTS